ncbi:LOW QUALITY PROTEIN: UV-endonuclease UvdE family [Geomicrobium sp. JCM 19055]|nr:LOW QUALITY PROTEIN: UV-endonuclease UvdE family [Geomicrobium sp. JCM 19055]
MAVISSGKLFIDKEVHVMTLVRLGYVAMSQELTNASPSQTMTFKQFQSIDHRDAAIRKLERIALSNLDNTLRILKHNRASDIAFYRLTSRLIPLANHEELLDWKYMRPLRDKLKEVGKYIHEHQMRVDFHPDHFVLLNSQKKEIFKASLKTLGMHYKLLRGNIDPTHRCVMHVGGLYKEKDRALERFIDNWGDVPSSLQQMIMLENDDKSFTLTDTLYLCEKLQIPLVFDYHHHLANHHDERWEDHWERVLSTWEMSPLPVKMHISSPKSDEQFRAHHDFVQPDLFFEFLHTIKGTVNQIDCMIEAKQKDSALFTLMNHLKLRDDVEIIDGASFRML